MCFQKQEPGDMETAGDNLNKLNLSLYLCLSVPMSGLDIGLLVTNIVQLVDM